MADTVTASLVCDICGADIREDSEFCYNCGGSLAKPELSEPAEPTLEEDAGKPPENETSEQIVQSPGSANGSKDRIRRPRNKPANSPRKHEMVWADPENGVPTSLVIGTVVFILITVGLLIAAYFIR